MNWVRRITVGIAGVVIVALAMDVVAPNAVRAVANLFVTVTNTSANPVPVSGSVANALDTNNSPIPLVMQNPVSGGNAFDVSGFCNFGSSSLSCDTAPYTVPDGKIAVIQSVTGTCNLNNGSMLTAVEQSYNAPNGTRIGSFPEVQPTQQGNGFANANFGGPLVNYAAGGPNGGGVIDVDFFVDHLQDPGRLCSIEIAGYLVNQ